MGSDARARELAGNLDEADISSRERAMIAFALRLTENPEDIRKAEIEKLRAEGLDDASIVDLVAVAAYFNLINRIALGLGVRLDEALVPGADPEELKKEMERLDGSA